MEYLGISQTISEYIYIHILSLYTRKEDYALGLMYTGSQTCARQLEAFFPPSEGSYSKNIKALCKKPERKTWTGAFCAHPARTVI